MVIPPEIQELLASKDRRIAELEALVAELLRRLGLDSTNSSKPPSSDGLKKKPRAPQSARQVGQGERRPGGPRGRYSAAGRQTRFRGSARGARVRALLFAARSEFEHRGREAAGVRASRAPAAGDRTSGLGPSLRALPMDDEGGVSRRRGLAGAIWRALQGGGGLHERPADDPRGSDRADDERHFRRAAGLFGQRRRLGGKEGGRADAGLRADRRARRRREGPPSRRDGLSDRRQAAMAAHDLEPLLHLLSRRRKARRHPQEFERRRHRPRPLQALQRARRGLSRLLQRPYPARTRGPDRIRKGTLGRTHARGAARGQRGGASGAGGGKAGAASRAGQGLRRALLGGGADGPGVSPPTARVGDEVQHTRASQTTPWPQSARQAEKVQNRNAAVPDRFRRALHQQPRRTGSEDDEGQDEDLRLFPDPGGRAAFRAPQIRSLDREEAGLQHPAGPHHDPRAAHAIPRRLIGARSRTRRSARTERGGPGSTEPARSDRARGKPRRRPETTMSPAPRSRAKPSIDDPRAKRTRMPPGLGVTKLQKKAPNALKSPDAELKSAPAFPHRNATASSSLSQPTAAAGARTKSESHCAISAGLSTPSISTVTALIAWNSVGERRASDSSLKRPRMRAPARTGATKRTLSKP